MKNRRKKLAIDPTVQWALVRRVLRHGAFILVMTEILLPFWFAFISWGLVDNSINFREALVAGWEKTLPVLMFFIVIAPIIVYDILKMSLRFAGPVYRLHKGIKSLTAGEETPPIRLRQDDFWKNVIADFNALAEQVASKRVQTTSSADLEPATSSTSEAEGPWEMALK